jgi:hypothetical protein
MLNPRSADMNLQKDAEMVLRETKLHEKLDWSCGAQE